MRATDVFIAGVITAPCSSGCGAKRSRTLSERRRATSVRRPQNPSIKVGIDGHTDPRGTNPYNQALSERRVQAIRDALMRAGVNRRVEILVAHL
jgi:flagellar motor protein MotB